MRRRLLLVSLSLVGLLLLALMVPLVATYASDRTQAMFVSRLGDVTRFAVVAEDALESGLAEELSVDLERYVDVYGGSVLVTDADRRVVAQAGAEATGDDPEVQETIERALSGAGSQPPATVWPWSGDDVVIGSPVGRDAQVLGAVVVVAPTSAVKDSIARGLAWLVAAGLVVVLVMVFGAVVPFVGWILRPVDDLEHAAKDLADGDLSSRAHELGPPELRHLARSFNAMVDNVEMSQRQQRELVADAAHQLGNPLTALRLRVENLAATGSPVAAVEPVLEETDRLSSIVDSLLRLSQVGAHRVAPVEVDVAEIVRERCEMWEPVFTRLRVDLPEKALALTLPDVVEVVLDSLLDNAAKFAPDSPVEVTVTGGDVPAEKIEVRVRDHGQGLHPDDVAKVGARFFRGRQHQNVPGTGLGLAIVRARVDDLGGSMVVSTPSDGGLEVAVVLPAATADALGNSALPPDEGAGAR
ncbi:HAMP domain-containing sensor histidine kinase [Nocardioides sp. CCNWLW239]|uniref:HAMP domain-containing sensor histidine kinase n=1 Tax=Nocardioides sp. CCNWLW239 TaxID=3128902 RepID=UPI00301A0CAB